MSSQENLFRTLKRNPSKRYQPIIKEGLEIGWDYIPSLEETEEFKNLKVKFGHIPMKKESKKIRKLMSDKNLSKSDIMNNPSLMNMIKDNNTGKSLESYEVLFLDIAKSVMKEKNLPVWNDEVIEAIKYNVRRNIEKYLNDNPYYQYYENLSHERCIYSFYDFIYFNTGLKIIDEVYIWKNILELNKNLFLKKYMYLAKKRKNKQK